MKKNSRPSQRGFTLIEVMIASMITAFVVGSVSMCLSQLGRAKSTSKERFDAHVRADAALNAIRRDIASVIRSGDLFWTRLLITDDVAGEFDRDEILLFCTRLRPLHDITFNGEGIEYEVQYRIEDDDFGSVLWQRRDAVPDEYENGGGVATPLVGGVVGLLIEAYDGEQWYEDWDSDHDGLPMAVRVTVTASGDRDGDEVHRTLAILRTVIAINRLPLPGDEPTDEEAEAEETPEEAAEGAEGAGGEALDESGGSGAAGGGASGGRGSATEGGSGRNQQSAPRDLGGGSGSGGGSDRSVTGGNR